MLQPPSAPNRLQDRSAMWLVSKIVGIFTKVTAAAVKGTVDTVKGVTDIEKNRLDIKLKKQELEEKDRLVRPATFEEVKQYDPKIKQIEQQWIKSKLTLSRHLFWSLIALVIFILLLLNGLFFVLSEK